MGTLLVGDTTFALDGSAGAATSLRMLFIAIGFDLRGGAGCEEVVESWLFEWAWVCVPLARTGS